MTDTALDFGDWNPGVALKAEVDAAMAEYVEPDPVEPGQVVAVRCTEDANADYITEALESMAFEVDRLTHEGVTYVWISDLRGSDPDDAVFELGWHDLDVGTIPDPRRASSTKRPEESS